MRRVAIWIILWGGLLAGALYADRHKVSKDLADKLGQADAAVDIVVRYNGDPSDAELAAWTAKGANLKDHMRRLRTATFHVPAGLIDTLSDNPNVAYISIDRPVAAQFDYAEQAVNVPVAWAQGLDGSGVGIALIDSGIANHDDLEQANSHKSRVIYREVFNGRKGDEYGHGTHVAGILAGNGKSSTGPGFTYTYKGVAPNANRLDLEVMDDQGMTTDSLVIKAIDRHQRLSGHERGDRSGDWHCLCQPVRHFHDRRGIPGHHGCSRQQRRGQRRHPVTGRVLRPGQREFLSHSG